MVSRKLIWETLRRNGLTMKKVKVRLSPLITKVKQHPLRLLTLQQSALLSSEQNMCYGFHVGTLTTNWFLWTSHLSTATPHVIAMRGQLRGKGHQRMSSSVEASGESLSQWLSNILSILLQVLRPPSVIP